MWEKFFSIAFYNSTTISVKEPNYGYVIVNTGIFNVLKPALSPTYRPKLEAQKTCDIIHPSS